MLIQRRYMVNGCGVNEEMNPSARQSVNPDGNNENMDSNDDTEN